MRLARVSLLAVALPLTVALVPGPVSGQQTPAPSWPQRVLLTNDDGLAERRLWELAKAFSKEAMTYVVAPAEDQSGSSNFGRLFRKDGRTLFVRRDYYSDSLVAYGLSGYPADCVLFGVNGLLKGARPHLVVSGINGGENPGLDDWFGSGTIGAARTAAFLGIPAIAVSGLDDDDTEMVALVPNKETGFRPGSPHYGTTQGRRNSNHE